MLVDGGHAALVQAIPASGSSGGSLHLITDQGIRHPLSTPEVAGRLGYPLDRLVRMPAALLDRIPAGPTLDPDTATLPVSTTG